MMSIDEQELRAIAFLVARCRPTGAKHWDEAGIVANLRKVGHVSLPEVIMAATRAAANREADSPGVIPVTTGEHWREKVSERTRMTPPRKEDACRKHGGWQDNCPGCRADELAGDPSPEPKREKATVNEETRNAALAAAREAIAEASRVTEPAAFGAARGGLGGGGE